MSIWPEHDKTVELIQRARDGDSRAVSDLLERHRESLRRMIALRLDRKIQQRVDASDIVQDVLVDANRRIQDYLENPCMPFHLWLRHMARDRIIDAHRRHRANAKRSVDREQAHTAPANIDHSTAELMAQLSDGELTPAAAATMQELQLRFESAIGQLGEQDQEIVLMRHFEHLSNQEVAQALDLTEPAASMRYLRAMRRLRTLLSDVADEGGDEQ